MAKWLGLGLLVALLAGLALGYAHDTDPAAMKAKYADAASRFVDVGDGLAVHVRDEGRRDGPVLVLLHGSNASLHTWDPWVARLATKYRIVRIDQIGHGMTGPQPHDDYSAAAFVSTLDAVVSRLGITRFALAGNSMGGYVAWEYALAHPAKVSQLVLVDAGGPPDDPHKSLPLGFRLARMPGINRLAEVITPRSVFEKSLRQTVSNQAVVTPAVVDRYWELNRYPGNRRATRLRMGLWAERGRDVPRLGELKMPVLILWGAEDKLIPASGAPWFAARIPGARAIVYPGVGHLPMEEVADRSAADVDAFLSLPIAGKPA
ncbi:MAG: alpha/beta hydrolase [Proteobacteria bacterium]|nr:alpha/beta hydrolase [Pseudomonadota bacterium]